MIRKLPIPMSDHRGGGIRFYRSPDFEALVEAWVSNYLHRIPDRDPFASETVVVHSHAMSRHLSSALTRRFGVTALIEYLLPTDFENRIRQSLLPDRESGEGNNGNAIPSRENPFDPIHLRWYIFLLLTHPDYVGPIQAHPGLSVLIEDRGGGNKMSAVKAFELSGTMAELFNTYLFFREELLWDWEHSREESPPEIEWQKWLWQTLRQHLPFPHRLEELDKIKDVLKGFKGSRGSKSVGNLGTPIETLLPFKRISVFGISFLPSYYLELFHHLGKVMMIDYYYPDTSRPMFSPSESSRPRFMRQLTELSDAYQEMIEKLSWPLHDLPSSPIEGWEDSWGILRSIKSFFSLPVSIPEDGSDGTFPDLLVHSCPSPRREVEVVKTHILALLERHEALTLDEILILAPDIMTYRDCLESVFTSDPVLPYYIIDYNHNHNNALIQTLSTCLNLFLSDWETEKIREIISGDLLKAGWGWDDEDILLFERWLEDMGVRWGRGDAPHPDLKKYSWKEWIRRVMLHFCLPVLDENTTYDEIAITKRLDGEEGKTLGKMSYFLYRLLDFDRIFSQPATIGDWFRRIRQLSHDLIYFQDREYLYDFKQQKDHLRLVGKLRELEGRYTFALEKFTSSPEGDLLMALSEFQSILENSLQDSQQTEKGGHVGITCGSLLPLRIIPSGVTFLMGMGRDDFPRRDKFLHFNLTLQSPRPGDRTGKKGDQQLFIETLFATRHHLGITYSPLRDSLEIGGQTSPSVLVEELLTLLAAKTGITQLSRLHIKHPLIPVFSGEGGESRLSYDHEDYLVAVALAKKSHFPKSEDPPPALTFIEGIPDLLTRLSSLDASLSPPSSRDQEVGGEILRWVGVTGEGNGNTEIFLEDWKSFFTDAPQFYFRRILWIDLRLDVEREDQEPLVLEGLDSYRILSDKITEIAERLLSEDVELEEGSVEDGSAVAVMNTFFSKNAIERDPRFPAGSPGRNQLEMLAGNLGRVRKNLLRIKALIPGFKMERMPIDRRVMISGERGWKRWFDNPQRKGDQGDLPREIRFYGEIDGVIPGENLRHRVACRYLKITTSDLLRGWCDHLLLNLDAATFTWLIGESEVFLFTPVTTGLADSDTPRGHLDRLLLCYWGGHIHPLPLYRDLMEAFHKSREKTIATIRWDLIPSLLFKPDEEVPPFSENRENNKKQDTRKEYFSGGWSFPEEALHPDPEKRPYAHLAHARWGDSEEADWLARKQSAFTGLYHALWESLYLNLRRVSHE